MEKAAEDWDAEVEKLKRNPAASANYLINGRAPRAGEIFRQTNLARTFRTLARGGRDAFYNGEIARAITDYCQKNGGFLSMEDLAAQKSEWVEPISTNYRGYTVYEIPPNGQGLTALLMLNILEGFDLASMSSEPDRFYHTLIEATRLAFADRNRYIADPAFAKVPVAQLLSKEYAAKRRALIDPSKALNLVAPGEINVGSDTTYFTVVDKDGNAVSFINSLFDAFGSGIVAGDTGIVLQNRGSGFSLDPNHPNRIEPGKRPFHTIIPAMVFKDNKLFMSFGVMGGNIQPQGHVQVLVNVIDLGMGLQQAIDAPRFRYTSGRSVLLEDEIPTTVIDRLIAMGHERASPPGVLRSSMGGGQAIMIDPASKTLMGASDPRKDGLALGY
jgi:gamma-glutamyltranspeptidase/glutathione hydrolase